MTPHAHHSNDLYLRAYQGELRKELTDAHSAGGTRHGIRRSIAQSFVRIGAWLLPEKTDLVDGRIVILEVERPVRGHQRAA